jgi:hypothetical protein
MVVVAVVAAAIAMAEVNGPTRASPKLSRNMSTYKSTTILCFSFLKKRRNNSGPPFGEIFRTAFASVDPKGEFVAIITNIYLPEAGVCQNEPVPRIYMRKPDAEEVVAKDLVQKKNDAEEHRSVQKS